jgi:hypothetical protein
VATAVTVTVDPPKAHGSGPDPLHNDVAAVGWTTVHVVAGPVPTGELHSDAPLKSTTPVAPGATVTLPLLMAKCQDALAETLTVYVPGARFETE